MACRTVRELDFVVHAAEDAGDTAVGVGALELTGQADVDVCGGGGRGGCHPGDCGSVTTAKSSDEVGSPWSLWTCDPR